MAQSIYLVEVVNMVKLSSRLWGSTVQTSQSDLSGQSSLYGLTTFSASTEENY